MGSSGRYWCRSLPFFLLVTGFQLTVTAEVRRITPGKRRSRLERFWVTPNRRCAY